MNINRKAIVVIGGGLWQDGNKWRTIDLGQGEDETGAINDRWRVDAAFHLWSEDHLSLVIASAGKGQLEKIPGAPTVSSVIKRELVELGVPSSAIIEEDKSGTTFEQLRELSIVAKQKGISSLLIVSNEWHLPRIKAMLEHAPGLKEAFDSFEVELVSAEEVLLRTQPEDWHIKIGDAREDPAMQRRFTLEKKGVRDIIAGTYKY